MALEANAIPDDLEQLRRRFEEFRTTRSGRSRFPETLWTVAAEMAKRYGVNRTAQVLRLEYGGLRKRAENQLRPRAKNQKTEPAGFLEFLAPSAKPMTKIVEEVAEMSKPALDDVQNFPAECHYVLEMLGRVYGFEAEVRERGLNAAERLQFHQQHSGPVMAELHRWLEVQLAVGREESRTELRLRPGNHLSAAALARVDGLPARSQRSP